MKTEKIEEFSTTFLKVKLEPIEQKGKIFYLTKIPAKYFLDLFTVEPAKYDIAKQTALAAQFPDDGEYYRFLIERDEKRIKEQPFERKESKDRINKIRNFLNEEEFAFFPNTIIVNCELINDSLFLPNNKTFQEFDEDEIDFLKKSNLAFLEKTESDITLYVPYKKDSLVIIDGQHRIKGLQLSENEIWENYDLIVAFIIEVDRSIIAKQFYTINYYQKPVNKSLLYHLSGEFSDELDEITFLHETVKILNEIDYSPFFQRVRMLGTVPRDLSPEIRRKMTISQAFLIDYLRRTISESSKNSIYSPIFLYYFRQKDLQIEIIRILIKYFKAIQELKLDDWNNPQDSIICKTIGIGAFIRALHFIFVKIFIDEFTEKPKKIKEIKTSDFKEKLRGIEEVDFSKEGPFGGVASGGSLNQLKEDIIEKIEYLEGRDYGEFLSTFTERYLNRFRKWIHANT